MKPTTQKAKEAQAKRGREKQTKKRAQLPPCTSDLVSSQAEGTIDRHGGPPEDCTRVFPIKGAADALCNPKADVPRSVAGQATHGTRLRRNPCDDLTKGWGPPHSAGLQDQRTEGGTQGSNLRGSVLKGVFAGPDLIKKNQPRRERPRRERRCEGGTPGDPNVRGTAPADRGGVMIRAMIGAGAGAPGVRWPWREEEEEAALFQLLRIALWRRTLSPPPPQQRAWSPHR